MMVDDDANLFFADTMHDLVSSTNEMIAVLEEVAETAELNMVTVPVSIITSTTAILQINATAVKNLTDQNTRMYEGTQSILKLLQGLTKRIDGTNGKDSDK